MVFYTKKDGVIDLNQYNVDGPVRVSRVRGDDISKTTINPSDFIMLLNLYEYIIENDIQNDFINPNGKNKEA